MGALSSSIVFEGYWREKKKRGIPAESGVYCVYTGIHHGKKQTVSPQKLVYIGEAQDVRLSLSNHEKQEDWESHIESGEELCFNFGPVDPVYRERYAAALIFKHRPPENRTQVEPFPFDRTTLTLSGKAGFLTRVFTV